MSVGPPESAAADGGSVVLTELSYVGTRPYIRGADLYLWFERQVVPALAEPDRPRRVRRFKLIREVSRDGAWSEGGEQGASASIEAADAAGQVRRYAFHETGEIVSRRVPDIASAVADLAQTGDFAGAARLKGCDTTRAFLDGLIEANKRLHAATLESRGLGADAIRLVYIEEFPVAGGFRPDSALEFRHLGERRGPDRIYTLNAVRIDGGDASLRICYSYGSQATQGTT